MVLSWNVRRVSILRIKIFKIGDWTEVSTKILHEYI